MTRTGIRWFYQVLECCCLIFQVLPLVAWTSHLWKWRLKCRKLGVYSGITNLAVLAAQKRFRREFGVVVDWTFPLTINLCNNAGCVWKGKSPNRLLVHRRYRTKFELLVLVQENQDQLRDSWACDIGLCTEFCELVRCVKVTNTHRPRQAS
jgi:hypothetical protein